MKDDLGASWNLSKAEQYLQHCNNWEIGRKQLEDKDDSSFTPKETFRPSAIREVNLD